ncbi:putative membrane protein [Colletotrichum trifolii]|uniref:Putative membrane protein n=1 Tax=Colletotrichum trifolii TaxID=5466 RepID=A0A4R8QXW8_COLTR|nr:putative membrane protein [Colletotrichum trifolii]
MNARIGLAGLAATCVSGAYVQWQPCDGFSSKTDPIMPTSLSAKLESSNGGQNNVLTLNAGRWMDETDCGKVALLVPSATLEFTMLGRSSVYTTSTNTTCKRIASSLTSLDASPTTAALRISVSDDIGFLPPLSTFHTILHLQDDDLEEASCRQANITPALSSAVNSTITYTTWGVFLFVLLVGTIRSIYNTPIALDSGEGDRRSMRTVLPNVGDCLQYLQFVFLTGGLSLRYPGFYQPVLSNLSWFSLFINGPITHGATYDRVGDGIYVMNGTYGGTYGLELMTQIAGAAMTRDTWLNMVVLLVILVVGTALAIEAFWFVNPTRASNDDSAPSTTWGLHNTFSRVLRVILSYFSLPLTALSFYQLDNAAWQPAYHTSLAVTLILAMMVAFAWLLHQIPTRSLGLLMFDGAKRYRKVAPRKDFCKQDARFILTLFVLVFVRGAVVGGLQISGPAQLAALAASELVLLASIAGFQAYSTFSIGTLAASIRLCSLVCMVAFLPGFATFQVKCTMGYLLLALHASMLIFGFFVPAVYELGSLFMSWWKAPRPHVYGLRQLRRRELSRTDLSGIYAAEAGDTYPEPDAIEEPATRYLHPTYLSESPSTLRLASSTYSSRYYRPPRSPSCGTSVSSFDHHRRPESVASPLSSVYSPSRSISTSTTFTDKRSVQRSVSAASPSPGRLSESSEEESSIVSQQPLTAARADPLGPRWNDYSFREADLYYGVPRQPSERASEETPRPPAPKASFRSSSGIWAKLKGPPSEHGFHVVRSTPQEQGFVVIRPNRPSNLGDGSAEGAKGRL